MPNTKTKLVNWNIERKLLILLSILFVVVMMGAWTAAMKLKQTVSANNAVINVDIGALIEVERIRNMVESQIASSRAYFLLGSKALLDQQNKDKQASQEAMINFEKQYGLAQVPEIMKRIQALGAQQQDIFDQAVAFREKNTESKIVGQFYQSKAIPILGQINKALDEIVVLHNAELAKAKAAAREAALSAETQIPKGMMALTAALSALFAALGLLVIRMLNVRSRQMAERSRLYQEAQKAVQAREELISAISFDLNEPLGEINQTTDRMTRALEPVDISDSSEMIKSSISSIEDRIKDILDQSKADMGNITLRLDQLGVDGILEDARLMLLPLAKQRDVRLEINSVNPPVLAFVDKERVLRVLSNLVGNAIKFSPKHSKVTVKVRSDQQFVYVSVKDSGPGIPESQLPELFTNFWQARKTADQGAGVGLAVVKTIIEAHGGTVTAENQAGSGTTFTFSLPRRRPVGAHIGRPAAPAVRVKKSSHPRQADFIE